MATIELADAPLFFIPGLFHLTEENPGPVDFDPRILNPQQKQWINNAHRLNKVRVVNPDGPTVEEPPAKPDNSVPVVLPDRDAEREKIKNLLDSPLAALKKTLAESDDLRLLRMVKSVEETRPKPRKSLLKVVNQKLATLEAAVAARLGGEDVGGKMNPVQVRKEDTSVVELLEDEEEREIIIRPVTEEDFAEQEVTDE